MARRRGRAGAAWCDRAGLAGPSGWGAVRAQGGRIPRATRGRLLEAQEALVGRRRAAGVRMPALHRGRTGDLAQPGPGGTWLRVYDWMDAGPADLASPETAGAVGALLARLHRGAPTLTSEVDGTPPDPWFEVPPTAADLETLAGDAAAAGVSWAGRLADRLRDVPGLLDIVRPVDPARLVLCHRDLHPGNVLLDETGGLVVLDPDDVGPADPVRELGRALFDFWSDPTPDLELMDAAYRAYVVAGGPARLRRPGDLTMLVAQRLNFLARQVEVALDPTASADDRAWADQEIDEALRILPTRAQVDEVLGALAAPTT
ncbi:MAG: aminoglycoside phosphotransferase family protein [Chloroflexota bacterium]